MLTAKKAWLWILGLFEDEQGVPDEARVGAGVLIGTFCYCTVLSVQGSPTHEFNFQLFGFGAGALAGGLGAWLGLRKDN